MSADLRPPALGARWGPTALALGLAAVAHAGPDAAGPPTHGIVRLEGGFTPDPHDVPLTVADAALPAAEAGFPAPCAGRFSSGPPDLALEWAPGSAPLRIAACADFDTTLAVRGPDGALRCADDTEGMNPVLALEPGPAGRYEVWVGATAPGPERRVTVRLSEYADRICERPWQSASDPRGLVAAHRGPTAHLDNTPSAAADASPGAPVAADPLVGRTPPASGVVTLAEGFSPDPHVRSVPGGGPTDASTLGLPEGCVGHVDRERPDVRVYVNWRASAMRFAACGPADTTLIARSPRGEWRCADDTEGVQPVLDLSPPLMGEWTVWIGSRTPGERPLAALTLTTGPGPVCAP